MEVNSLFLSIWENPRAISRALCLTPREPSALGFSIFWRSTCRIWCFFQKAMIPPSTHCYLSELLFRRQWPIFTFWYVHHSKHRRSSLVHFLRPFAMQKGSLSTSLRVFLTTLVNFCSPVVVLRSAVSTKRSIETVTPVSNAFWAEFSEFSFRAFNVSEAYGSYSTSSLFSSKQSQENSLHSKIATSLDTTTVSDNGSQSL